MANRVLGLKEETTYGTASDNVPDWHQEVSKAKATPNTKPMTYSGGSRSVKKAKAGVMKPEASYDMKCDLKRIGHYMKAFLGNYVFTAGGNNTNIHEFWGGENTELPSFTGWSTFDIVMKKLVGMLCDSLKLEVGDEFMDGSVEWKYQNETRILEVPEPADQKMIPDDTLIAFYDIAILLDSATPPGIVSKFSFEGKNNLNIDKTIGLGSRKPQTKAKAQKREVTLSIESTLVQETLDLIAKAEYGEVADSPSECKLYKLPLKLTIHFCEDATDSMEILFPECIFSVDYEASDADEIDVKFELQTMATKKVTLADGTTEVVTDMYVKLQNNQPKIQPGAPGTANVNFTVQSDDTTPVPVQGATVTITNRITDAKLTSSATSASGACSIATVPLGSYNVEVKSSGNDVLNITPLIVSVNETPETFVIKVKD